MFMCVHKTNNYMFSIAALVIIVLWKCITLLYKPIVHGERGSCLQCVIIKKKSLKILKLKKIILDYSLCMF